MTDYIATIQWRRQDSAAFVDNRYSRRHVWSFDGGVEVPASASPQVVRPPLSDPAAVDPEEAFVASLSSCHMLWFLSLAAKRGFVVDAYSDEARGVMGENADGKSAILTVTLSPACVFSGDRQPSVADIEAMHHATHENCFIANSVKSEIRCHPRYTQS